MGHQAIQKSVALKLLHTFQGILLDMGRNQETTLACGTAGHHEFGGCFVQVNPDLRFIYGCSAGGGVVHLQQQTGARPNQCAGIIPPDIGLASRCEAAKGFT